MKRKILKRLKWRGDKNTMVLRLLSHVPEFKEDVNEIRREMGIKNGGFKWGDDDMREWAIKKDISRYDWDEDTDAGGDKITEDFPEDDFEKKMFELGTKYKLPFNFYAFPYRGLPCYVLSDDIVSPDSNYTTEFRMIGDKFVATSLIVYVPLSDAEAKEAVASLRETQLKMLPIFIDGIDVFGRKRYRDNIERDLVLLDEQIKRSSKPKKTKTYEPGSYMDIVSKKNYTAKKIRGLERMHKKDVVTEYNEPTSKQIGKRLGVTGDATRQAKKRLNLLANELFGHDLES